MHQSYCLKFILAEHGVPYSTYNYWRNKITSNDKNLPIMDDWLKMETMSDEKYTYHSRYTSG